MNQIDVSEKRDPRRVLLLCTHNSARSQMAEGLLRALGADRFEVFSAATQATSVRPLAIRVMAEYGIDISNRKSKTLEQFLDQQFDAVITVCDQANEARCSSEPGIDCTGVFLIRARPLAAKPSSSRATARCATLSVSGSRGSCCLSCRRPALWGASPVDASS